LPRSASYPCPFRQDRAPWPPSLLRQAPIARVYHRACSIFPGFIRFPSTILYPFGSRPRVGPSAASNAPAAVRLAKVCKLPPSVRPRTAPPGRLHPCTRTPIVRVASPGTSRLSPAIADPAWKPFSSRLPDSRGPICCGYAATAPRLAKVCKLPLSVTAGQSPLAAIPPAPGPPLSQISQAGCPRYQAR